MRLAGYLGSPAEIEDVLRALPGVAEAHVVAVEIVNRMQGVAFAITLPGYRLDEKEMLNAAARTLAAFKTPASVWIVDRFPMVDSSNGIKIQRTKLRELALEKLAMP